MQLTMTPASMTTGDILCDELYRGDDILLLDCRNNEDYHRGHIKGAYNIVLPQLMMRRLKADKLPLKSLVPPNLKQERETFLHKITTSLVVIYDEFSETNENNMALLSLLHKRMTSAGCKVAVLKGGYSKFYNDHPEFCNKTSGVQKGFDVDVGTPSCSGNECPGETTMKQLVPVLQSSVLGLESLRISDSTPHPTVSKSTIPATNGIDGGLLARRSRRNGRCAPEPLAIRSEAEPEDYDCPGAASLSLYSEPPRTACPENRPDHESENLMGCSSPSSFPTFGNNTAPVEILPCLFLGCARDASSAETLARYNITYILNVTSNLPNVFENEEKYHYKQIAISDHWSQNLSQFFPEAVSFIDEARSKNCGVLVHCLAGISRSVTVTVAYLMQKNHWSLNDAYDFVKQRKSNVSPNFNFMGQLLDFEKTLGITQPAGDSGISSSSSTSNSPPTLFFTSPPPPTPSGLVTDSRGDVSTTCSSGSRVSHSEHRNMFCLPTPMT